MKHKKRHIIMFTLLIVCVGLFSCKGKEGNQGNLGETKVDKEELQIMDEKVLESEELKNVVLPFTPTIIKPQVPEYTIAEDLSNISNIQDFGYFSKEQQKFLAENGFLITEPKFIDAGKKLNRFSSEEVDENKQDFECDQIFDIYIKNSGHYPSFITSDSMTHIFHIFYDGLLRNVEMNEIHPKLVDMTKALLKSSIEVYQTADVLEVKDAALRNVAFFGVGAKLLDIEIELPEEAKALVSQEMESIESKKQAPSVVNKKEIDFSQMTVRGHYTRNDILKKYFLTVMYYGQIGFFPLNKETKEMDKEALLSSVLMTYSICKDKAVYKMWTEVCNPIDFLVESAEDLSIREFGKIFYEVYGEKIKLNHLADEDKLKQVFDICDKLPKPEIQFYEGQSFRFLPQRAVMDSVYMQNVVDVSLSEPSKRPIYSGLDLMTAFGNKMAKSLTENDPYNHIWEEYPHRMEENIKKIDHLSEQDWQKNLYRGWLWMLKSYSQEFGEGYPMFMRNDYWKKKDLISALGSYAELKHDTVLYSKQPGGGLGGGRPPVPPKSYVEPNLELFEKLSWLLEYTKVNLEKKDMLGEKLETKIDRFKDLVDQLVGLVKKELNNEAFTEEELYTLYYSIGRKMEEISLEFYMDGDGSSAGIWAFLENETDRRMPVICDLMTVAENACDIISGKKLSIGTGAPAEIYVVYPNDEGGLNLGRGGIFTYYEFLSDERLTDEQWQQKLLNEKVPYPKWYADMVKGKKEEP